MIFLKVLCLQADYLPACWRSLLVNGSVGIAPTRIRLATLPVHFSCRGSVFGSCAVPSVVTTAIAAPRTARQAVVVVVNAVVPLTGEQAGLAVSITQRRNEMIDEGFLQFR